MLFHCVYAICLNNVIIVCETNLIKFNIAAIFGARGLLFTATVIIYTMHDIVIIVADYHQ